jgi:hypothetical protein
VIEAAQPTLEVPTDHGLVARWIARFVSAS